LDAIHAKGMVNGLINMVALPVGFKGSSDQSGSDMAMMSGPFEELVHQGRNKNKDSMKSDLQWRLEKRTGLRVVKDLTKLIKCLRDLLKLRDRVLKNTM
jgi:hypothetical protein